jgi:hypothetical protein
MVSIQNHGLMRDSNHVRQCFLCRRVQWIPGGHEGEWESLTGFLAHYRLELSSLVVVDTYCDECLPFYQQQMAYGRRADGDATAFFSL